MTKNEAIAFVRSCGEDEGPDDAEHAAELFAALYDRVPDADESADVWSLICAAVDDVQLTWTLSEDECRDYDTVDADTAEEALEIARDNVERSNYDADGTQGTIWIDVRVECVETGEEASDTVTLDAPEPDCTERAHDWQSPAFLGGLAENPGVWGNGGGVIIREVCVHCGCGRATNTWAQRPDNGEQGLTSVEYTEGEYVDEVRALRESEAS